MGFCCVTENIETPNERCSLNYMFLKSRQNSWKITVKDFCSFTKNDLLRTYSSTVFAIIRYLLLHFWEFVGDCFRKYICCCGPTGEWSLRASAIRTGYYLVNKIAVRTPFFTEYLRWLCLFKIMNYNVYKQHWDTYSGPCQTSKMVHFAAIINNWKLLPIFAKYSILNVWQGSEYTSDT